MFPLFEAGWAHLCVPDRGKPAASETTLLALEILLLEFSGWVERDNGSHTFLYVPLIFLLQLLFLFFPLPIVDSLKCKE